MFRSSISTSKTTTVLESVPEIPLVSLEDGQLLALMDSWGRLGKVALRRFMAGLPEVARRGLYRRRGCSSVAEYAAKVTELSRDVVGQLMVLHSKIVRYWSRIPSARYCSRSTTTTGGGGVR